ncbi:TPA: GTPase RsgA [Candidatus Woesearchaeota archaeon]|nr:GTPase RsgA [Candidatus Woesearchaeota archaeon]
MSKNFWKVVNDVIRESDIVLEVLDARFIEHTRNKEIEDKMKRAGKVLIYVINKCDLVQKSQMDKAKRTLKPAVFISAKEHLGTSYLREAIMRNAPKDRFKVGVLGYPNTGKSSVINALKGKTAAKTSPISGYTKGLQLIKISTRMYLLDSPGVFPYREKDESKHAIIAAKTFQDVKNPEEAALRLLEEKADVVAKYYKMRVSDDPEELLERLAKKLNRLKKGGEPDTYTAARVLLQDWQRGKIKESRDFMPEK